MLTAKQIVEKGIIFMNPKYMDPSKNEYGLKLELEPAQIGIDLHMVSMAKVVGKGYIPLKGKTVLAKTEKLEPKVNASGALTWDLEPGTYEIGLAEGCNFDEFHCSRITHRSSLYRNATEINSPWFDPGFHTEEMGTFLTVKMPIEIEVGARVCQMPCLTTEEAAELYDGHWQATKQQHNGDMSHEIK